MRCSVRCASALGLAAGLWLGACGEPTGPPPPVVLELTASDTIQVAGGRLTFTAVARDGGGGVVPGVTITWSVSDPARGQITPSGLFTAGPAAGSVSVQAAVLQAGLAESVAVRVVVPGTVKWIWAAADVGRELPNIGGPALGPDGIVYVIVVRDAQLDLSTLVALSAGGEPVWTLPLEGIVGNHPVVTPGGDVLLAGKQVYVVRSDGTVRWQALMEANTPGFKGGAINAEVAFVAHGYNLSALALATGDTLWQSARAPLSSWLVPPTVVGTDVVYAKHTADTLFVFRQSDGSILNTYLDPDTGVDKRVFGTGTVPVGARFYLPTYNRLAAFDTAGPLLWLTDETGLGVTEPVVGPDGTLYVQHLRYGLEAMTPDGTTRWYRRRWIPPVGPYSEQPRWSWHGGPALAEGGIVYGAGWDRFFAYNADGALLWEHLSDSAGVPQAFIGAPAIAPDGTVYTFTATHVYAFWASAPPEPNSPWPMWRHDAQRTGWAR
jgi:outer membrane protein assembly factor BamB